jgi:hypothetical protein
MLDLNDLIDKFHGDMIQTYLIAKRLKYNASYFYKMVIDMGGYRAAKVLIHTNSPSAGSPLDFDATSQFTLNACP